MKYIRKVILLVVIAVCLIYASGISVMAGESTTEKLFTSTVYETNNTLFMDFELSSYMQDKYMLISGYNSNEIVGRKIIPSQNAENLLLMGCKEKPTDLKINVWESLANIKPVADYTEFEGKDENGVQNFTPVNGFPTKYEKESNEKFIEGNLALVTGSVISTNEEGDRVITVTFLQNGEEKTLSVDADATINTPDTNMFVRGDAFEYNVNAEGFIDDAKFCGFGSTVPIKWQEVKALASTIPTKKSGDADFTYIGGYVVAKKGSTLTLANTFNAESGDKAFIPSTANVYVMDVTRSKVIPQIIGIGDIVACEYYTLNGVDYAEEDANTFVLIKYVDKEIVDVIAYCGFDL